MLKTRVLTALILLAILLPVLFMNAFLPFALVTVVFFAAASWESFRLFGNSKPWFATVVWTAIYAFIVFIYGLPGVQKLFWLCAALWAVRFAPALGLGLPPLRHTGNRLLNATYSIAIFGCFIAVVALFQHSPLYLLSVMAVVWVADVGAYFSGKMFGRHKLAPGISPGKSWEGAIGGWLLVLICAALTSIVPALADTFPAALREHFGWPGLVAVMTVLVVASVVGDLFESMLKRRAEVKDSSGLLPGHGGVLDRIDALIPVLPLAALLELWL
ncbi:MAG TPA: phosphatidate cytidylyltransferase [Herbaspirillum sp.]|jgi:phosphatidate cytidylyltransferase